MKYVEGYVCALGSQHLCFQSSLSVSDWASWVQAIGSIAAIAGALLIVRHQHVLQEKAKDAAEWDLEINMVDSFLVLVDDTIRRADAVFENSISPAKAHAFLTPDVQAGIADLRTAFAMAQPCFDQRPGLALPYASALRGVRVIVATTSNMDSVVKREGVIEDWRERTLELLRQELGSGLQLVIDQRVHFFSLMEFLEDQRAVA